MPTANAIRLIRNAMHNDNLCEHINNHFASNELHVFLINHGLVFSQAELEEAITHLHTQCQTWEQANELMHIGEWLRMMLQPARVAA